MIPDAFRTDNNACDHPDHPSPSDLADDNPSHGPRLEPWERAELVTRLAALQATADRVRCHNPYCRTTLDINDWPPTVQNCGHPICDRCITCDECDRGAA